MKIKSGLIAVTAAISLLGASFGGASSFAEAGTMTATATPAQVGAYTKQMTIKSVETVDGRVFLVATVGSTNIACYASADSDVSKAALKLKAGDKAIVRYVMGTPVAYKDGVAVPLSSLVPVSSPAIPVVNVKIVIPVKPAVSQTSTKPAAVSAITTTAIVINPIKQAAGDGSFKGKIKSIEKSGVKVFVTVASGSETRIFCISAGTVGGQKLLKLKAGTNLLVTYVSGKTVVYKNSTATAMSQFAIVK